jgi:multidrug efflux pump subunit AcrA (membrane-fusion protein)
MSRVSVRALLVVGAAVALAFIALRFLSGATPTGGDADIVRRGDLTIDVPANGFIAAARSVDLTAPISSTPHFFRISRLLPEGTVVKPGDTVMELDTQEVKRQLEDDGAEAGRPGTSAPSAGSSTTCCCVTCGYESRNRACARKPRR